jgi:hypothetical protein
MWSDSALSISTLINTKVNVLRVFPVYFYNGLLLSFKQFVITSSIFVSRVLFACFGRSFLSGNICLGSFRVVHVRGDI